MGILEWITEINNAVNGFVWGWVGLILLLGTGVITTVVTKVFQVSHLGQWWKNTIGSLFKRKLSVTQRKREPFLRSRRFVPPLPQR